jgi:hypothetical protein
VFANDQPRCDSHNRPMFISNLDRQHNLVKYACPEPHCTDTGTLPVGSGIQVRP